MAYKTFTIYKANGTTQTLYGDNPLDAMDSEGWDIKYVAENVRDYREGIDSSLEFINGKWYPKEIPEVKFITT